jgi:hypothetical protein
MVGGWPAGSRKTELVTSAAIAADTATNEAITANNNFRI